MNRVFNFIRPLQDRQFNNLAIGLLIVGMLAMIIFVIQARIFQRQDVQRRQPVADAATTSAASDEVVADDLPPFTDAVRAQLESSRGFQYLVSYTDRGFEPAELNVALGETVRFTNNSSEALRLTLTDEAGQSPAPAGCDDSAGCRLIGRGEFWEMTFEKAGITSFVNGTQRGEGGIVHVNAR